MLLFYTSILASRVAFIEKYVKTARTLSCLAGKSFDIHYDDVRRFTRSRLRPDGVFVLRLVSSNAGDVVTTAVIRSMWLQFMQDKQDGDPTTLSPLTSRMTSVASNEKHHI